MNHAASRKVPSFSVQSSPPRAASLLSWLLAAFILVHFLTHQLKQSLFSALMWAVDQATRRYFQETVPLLIT